MYLFDSVKKKLSKFEYKEVVRFYKMFKGSVEQKRLETTYIFEQNIMQITDKNYIILINDNLSLYFLKMYFVKFTIEL